MGDHYPERGGGVAGGTSDHNPPVQVQERFPRAELADDRPLVVGSVDDARHSTEGQVHPQDPLRLGTHECLAWARPAPGHQLHDVTDVTDHGPGGDEDPAGHSPLADVLRSHGPEPC